MRLTVTITERNPVHIRLSIWINGGLICSPGGICLRVDELTPFLERLRPDACWERLEGTPVKQLDGFWEVSL